MVLLSCRLQLSEQAKDLLRRMLERKVSDRLGCGPGGATELKRAPFLSSLDFNRVLTGGYKAEFTPPASTSQTDVRCFDPEFTSEPATDSLVVSQMTETMVNNTKFVDFTYVKDEMLK